MFNQGYTQTLELILVQFNTKMSLAHFDKHLACNNALHEWTMHEQIEKCLNISVKCHKGPTQIHTDQMGLSPIKTLKKFCLENMNPTIVQKIPNFKNLS